MSGSPRVLFVCLGNICRSPLAEAALRAAVATAHVAVEVDSAGTSDWHVGDPPDERTRATARRHGLDISAQRARQVEAADFTRFTHMFALDAKILAKLRAMAPADATAEIALLLDCVPGREGRDIADPYDGGTREFEATWRDVDAAARALARRFAG